MAKTETLLVIDGSNYIHRGYWAMNYNKPEEEKKPELAVRGLINIVLSDLVFVEATHAAVVFDRPGENFRTQLYPEYKAHREPSEIELWRHINSCRKMLRAMGIPVYGKLGHEGDDQIGSLATVGLTDSKKCQVYIGSRDKDFASLVTDRLHLLHPQKLIIDESGVYEKWGVSPAQMVEYLMLLGDKVDNIPGVNKIGAITAAKILNQHDSIEKWLKTKMTPAMKKNVDAWRDFRKLSKKLITIKTNCFKHVTLEKLRLRGVDKSALSEICAELEFNTLKKQIITQMKKLT